MRPQHGDILVSRSSGSVAHRVVVVPDEQQASFDSHDRAVDCARTLAAERHVDAWLTEDLIHFVLLASNRER